MTRPSKLAYCTMPGDPLVHVGDFDNGFQVMLCLAGAWTHWRARSEWDYINTAPTCLFCIAEVTERGWT